MSEPTRSGIPTTYRGTNFRSRLEARWAAFFDLVGWTWTYEPLDADGYIPDFLIHGPSPMFVEVGPCITKEDYEAKSAKPTTAIAQLGHDVLIVGVDVLSPFETMWEGYGGAHRSPGLFGEAHQTDEGWQTHWDPGVWTTCTQHESVIDGVYDRRGGCGAHGVTSDTGSYVVRPCRHYPGGRVHEPRFDPSGLWARAGNQTQWRGRAA